MCTLVIFQNGVFFGPVASVPILLFSGFFVNFNTIPGYLQWVPYVSYIRYGFEGAMISIYGYGREKLSCSEAYCHFRNPTKFLEEMDMATAKYWIDAVALGGFFILLRCVAYIVLRLKLRSKRWTGFTQRVNEEWTCLWWISSTTLSWSFCLLGMDIPAGVLFTVSHVLLTICNFKFLQLV